MSKIYIIRDIAYLNLSTISNKDNLQFINYLDTSNITNNKIFSLKHYKPPFPSRAKRKITNQTILYSTVGIEYNHFGIIENNTIKNLIASTAFTTIDVKNPEINPKYLFYKLTQSFITKHLQSIAQNSVSTIPAIRIDDIGNLKFAFPSIKKQNKIANILSSLDDKIEINNKINEKLEAMAKALYEYWFVQFEFPDEQGNPYFSSGGEMKYSPELKKPIPKDWQVEKISESVLLNIISAGINNFDGEKIYLATADVMNNDINFNAKKITYNKRPLRANLQPKINTLFFAKMKNSTKHLCFGNYSKPILSKLILSTGFFGFKVKDYSLYYVRNYFFSDHFESLKDNFSTGATQEAVNEDFLKCNFIIEPPNKLLKLYNNFVTDFYNKIEINIIQNQLLSSIRDYLLPMLMNGQVEVKH